MPRIKKLEIVPRKKFSLVLDLYTHLAVKKYCIDKQINMYEFFDEAVKKHLKDCQKKDKKENEIK